MTKLKNAIRNYLKRKKITYKQAISRGAIIIAFWYVFIDLACNFYIQYIR